MIRVIDVMSVGSDTLLYVIKSKDTGQIYWSGSFREFVREISVFFMLYFCEVLVVDVDKIKSHYLIVLYI